MGGGGDLELARECKAWQHPTWGLGVPTFSYRCHSVTRGHPVFATAALILLISLWAAESRPRSEVSTESRSLTRTGDAGSIVPWAARPRSRSRGVGRLWQKCHAKFVKEVQEAELKDGYDVIFYGDSMTEAWRGTFMGSSWTLFADVPKIWATYFGNRYRAATFGISGDVVSNVFWRLLNGELPRKKSPKAIVIQAGTSDVEGATCNHTNATETANRLRHLVHYVHSIHPKSHILVLSLLPKGEDWPNMCSSAIEHINQSLKALATTINQVHFFDFTDEFLVATGDGKWEINEQLLPDSLHPSRFGMERIARVVGLFIARLLAEHPAPAPAPITLPQAGLSAAMLPEPDT